MSHQNDIDKYRKKVKILKLSVYTLFTAGIISLVLWISISFWLSRKGNLSFVRLIAATLSSLKVAPATISGINSNGTKYYLTSKTLKNYIDNFLTNKNITFDEPFIFITTINGTEIKINALGGNIDNKTNKIHLNQDISIVSNTGYNINAHNLIFNPKDSSIYSDKNIDGTYGKHRFIASGFKIDSSLNHIIIEGPLTINLDN